jgi:DNA-binding transcriptional ArsR family regulator
MENFKPADSLRIEDLETLRTFADPLRAQIYEILLQAPASVRQVGERLGLAPSRLYYHVNLMEKLGLIRVVETRMVANMVEKVYRSAAYKLDVARELLDFQTDTGQQAITGLLTSGLEATREDLLRSLQARQAALEEGAQEKPRHVMVSRTTARIPDGKAEEFRARLSALIEEFETADLTREQDGAGQQDYALLVAFYPSFYFGER